MIHTRAVQFKHLLRIHKPVRNEICEKYILTTKLVHFYRELFDLYRVLREIVCRIDEPRIYKETIILMDYFVHLQKCIYSLTYLSIGRKFRSIIRKRDECHEKMTSVYKLYPSEDPSYELIPCYKNNGIYYECYYIVGGVLEDYP